MAAGSVINEPSSGTTARPSQACTNGVGSGAARASANSRLWTIDSTGLLAATTITTNTNSGSVYCSDSA